MRTEKIAEKIDGTQPVVVEWALGKYRLLKAASSGLADLFLKNVFSGDFVGEVLGCGEPELVEQMLSQLPEEIFEGRLADIAAGFERGEFAQLDPGLVIRVVAANDKTRAMDLLESGTQGFSLEQKMEFAPLLGDPHESSSVRGYTLGLVDQYLDKTVKVVVPDEDLSFLAARLALAAGHTFAGRVVDDFIRLSLSAPDLHGDTFCYRLIEVLGFCDMELDLFFSIKDGLMTELPRALDFLYGGPGKAAAFQQDMVSCMGEDTPSLETVQDRYHGLSCGKTKSLLRALTQNTQACKLERDDPLYGNILGTVTAIAWYNKRVSIAGDCPLEIRDIRELLLMESEVNPFAPVIEKHLRSMDPATAEEVVLSCLGEKESGLGGDFIFSLMGLLKSHGFMQPLFRIIFEDLELRPASQVEAAIKILGSLGNPVILHLEHIFENIEPEFFPLVLFLVEMVDTPEAEGFLMDHLDRFMEFNEAMTLSACTKILSGRAVKYFEERGAGENPLLDKLFVTFSRLGGKRDELFKDNSNRSSQDLNMDNKDAASAGDEVSSDELFLNIEMACESCGSKDDYKAYNIYCARDGEPYIAEEFECSACGGRDCLVLTPKGKTRIIKESIRMMQASVKSESGERVQPVGPITLLRTSSGGREINPARGIEDYKKGIRENPDDVESHIGLGHSYTFFKQYKLAEACYREAVRLSPGHIESYFSMAQIESFKGHIPEALEWLARGKKHLKAPLLCSRNETPLPEWVKSYRRLQKSLEEEMAGVSIEIRDEPVKKQKKTGRNQPCPCGSGKKYKKCCLNKV